jgi:hypothetical protein
MAEGRVDGGVTMAAREEISASFIELVLSANCGQSLKPLANVRTSAPGRAADRLKPTGADANKYVTEAFCWGEACKLRRPGIDAD